MKYSAAVSPTTSRMMPMTPRRRLEAAKSGGAYETVAQMPNSNRKWMLAFVLLGLFAVAASAIEEKKSTETKTVQPLTASSPSTLSSNIVAPRDEIYIDDEGIEGSGGRGELHDDLEKDSDYSGSGIGPDDEDSSTDQHQHHSRRPSIHTQSGISRQNTNDNDFINSRTHQTNSGTIIGSGTSGNSGIIGSGSAGNTGLNTIGKDHSTSATSSSSSPNTSSSSSTTLSTSATPNTNDHNRNTTNSNTTQTQYSSSSSPTHYPGGSGGGGDGNGNGSHHTIIHKNDDDDFDLGETIDGAGAGSGDGGIIDRDDEDDDDDRTGDDFFDVEGGGIGRKFDTTTTQHKQNAGVDEDIITSTHHAKDHLFPQPAAPEKGDRHDDFDEDDAQGNYDDGDDDDMGEDEDEDGGDDDDDDDEDIVGSDDDHDDGSEIYTDVTDPSSSDVDDASGSETTHKRPGINSQGGTIHELDTNSVNSLPPETKVIEHTTGNEVLIMNASDDDRATSFFAQPGILAAVIGGAVVGLLCAILVVMFIVYRMRKKDEGSYALDEPKRSPAVNSYAKNANNREFYA